MKHLIRGLRDVPYPFTAMLALCGDIDYCTPSRFKAVHRFLNTDIDTGGAGVGVGLDVGDTTFTLDCPPNTTPEPGIVAPKSLISSWASEAAWESGAVATRTENATRNTAGPTFVARYMRAGWIDGVHGGLGAYTNPYTYNGTQHAWDGSADGQAWLDFLTANSLSVDTYVYHSISQSDINNPGAPAPHGGTVGSSTFWADKLYNSGTRFLWSGLTQTIGGSRSVLTPAVVGGYNFWTFPRFNQLNGSDNDYYSQGNTFQHLISVSLLDSLTSSGGLVLLYVHLGNWTPQNPITTTPDPIFPAATQAAVRALRTRQDNGSILVARSSRLLRYNHMRDNSVWHYDPYTNTVNVTAIADKSTGEILPVSLDRCRGLTWYVDGTPNLRVRVNGVDVSEDDLMRASADGTGRASVGIRWYDYDRTDYTATTVRDAAKTGRLQPASTAVNLAWPSTARRNRGIAGVDGGLR